MMKASELLRETRKLIEKPENWTTGAWAKDAKGKNTHETSPNAVCWCAFGAFLKASDAAYNSGEYREQLYFAAEALHK